MRSEFVRHSRTHGTVASGGRVPTWRPLSARERSLIALEAVTSASGLGGGVYMATHPKTMMSLTYLQGTWFRTWLWPGVALTLFVGVCPGLVLVATILHRRSAAVGHVCVGAGLIAWVALEAAWIVVSLALQLTFATIGAVILTEGLFEWTASRRSARPRRRRKTTSV